MPDGTRGKGTVADEDQAREGRPLPCTVAVPSLGGSSPPCILAPHASRRGASERTHCCCRRLDTFPAPGISNLDMRRASIRRHRQLGTLLFAACLGVAAVPPPLLAAGPAVQRPDVLIDSVLAAYGGTAALAKVAGYRMEGTVASRMSGSGAMVRSFARPDRLKITLDYPGRPEVRILDGRSGWRSDGAGNLAAATGFLLTSMVLQSARADLPWLLDERRSKVRLLGPLEGGRLQGLELRLGDGLTLTVHVDAATKRIVRSAGVLEAPGMNTNFATDYSDFRTVDGILFAFKEANFASNQSTGTTVITRIVVNPPLTDRDFRP